MSEYARVAGGVVMELFTPPAGWAIGQCFHPDIAAQFVAVPSGQNPAEGWTWNGTVFAPPAPAPGPTMAEQAAAAIGAGCQVTSTATPALNGTYACDATAQAKIAAISLFIVVNSKFPGGAASYPWIDAASVPHVFPSTAEFQAFATAIADYVAALDMIIASRSGTLPSQPVAIP